MEYFHRNGAGVMRTRGREIKILEKRGRGNPAPTNIIRHSKIVIRHSAFRIRNSLYASAVNPA